MIIWIKRTDGSPVRLIDLWKPRIHMGGNYRDLLELACQPEIANSKFVEKCEKAGDKEKSRVLELEVDGDREAADLAKKIQKTSRYSKFRFYDIDIPSPQMYLYHKNLFPLALVEAEETSRGVDWTLQDSRESVDYQIPPLKTVKLQVNTKKTKKIRSFEDELASVQIDGDSGSLTIDSGDEAEKILGLIEAFQVEDTDVVVTQGGDSFIFPYLARRSQENSILDKLILGRDPSPLHVYEVQGHSYFSYGKILYRETAARLLGRLHVDQHNAFISADCGLTGLFEVSRTCIMPIQCASRATIGTNMTSLQLYHAIKQDVLIPWNKNQPEEWKDGNELVVADRGGFIYEPEYGIHDHIGELDFTSLYPKIMWQKNLSGETVKCSCCPDSTNRVPELDYNICQRWTGIVPLSLEILLTKRAIYKTRKKEATDETARSLYDQRQSALKWILVCCLPYDSPVLISQDGKMSYQHIGKIIDDQMGDRIGIFDCTKELFVAGLDKDLKSKFCRVSKLIKTLSPKKLLHVKMDDGRQVRCTSNHSFYILRNGLPVEVKATDLSKGDLVPVAKRVVHNNTTISNLDLLQQVPQQIERSENDLWRAKSNELRSLVNSSSNTLEVVLKREGRHVQNLGRWCESGVVPFHYLPLLPLPDISRELLIGRGRIGGGHVAWLPASLDLDEDLGFFLGFYVADGVAGQRFIRLYVGGNETEIIDHLSDITKRKFGLTPRVYKESKANMFVVQINSVSLVHILNRIFELPSSSATGKLKVPPLLFNASQEAILGFISGLVAGDGSVNKDRDHISIATHSYDFAVQIGYLALHLGIPFNIIKGKRLHRIYFVGPNGLHPFKELFLKKKHRTRFETIRTTCHADCRHAIFEMFPVEQSGLKEIATLTRTVRTPRLEGRVRVCPERARRSLQRIAGNPHSSRLRESHSRIMKLLDSDIGFVAVKEIEKIESSSRFVYCFEISDDENFPAFFTGTGGVLIHNSFGYLGFKNARFGKIDAHIATCAFSRKVLGQASALAEAHGFELVHGIVDSFWLRKPKATREEYEDLCTIIREKLGLPISFEGVYKWIVFLSSKIDSKVGVLNRYYGIFEDGTLKVRGIDLRRHDTPEIVRKCQEKMLKTFTEARDSGEFRLLIPRTLRVLEEFVFLLRERNVPLEDLVIVRNLSKNPDEYAHQVPQAIAARHLVAQGGSVHAGQQVSYILTSDQIRTAVPPEIVDEGAVYDSERYVDLLCSSTANLLLPLGYDTKYLRSMFKRTEMKRPAASQEFSITPFLRGNRPE